MRRVSCQPHKSGIERVSQDHWDVEGLSFTAPVTGFVISGSCGIVLNTFHLIN